jgi:hypothetical protein
MLQDGAGSTRHLVDEEGADVLEYYGGGGIDFDYLKGSP